MYRWLDIEPDYIRWLQTNYPHKSQNSIIKNSKTIFYDVTYYYIDIDHYIRDKHNIVPRIISKAGGYSYKTLDILYYNWKNYFYPFVKIASNKKLYLWLKLFNNINKCDYNFFIRRYNDIELDLSEILKYIHISEQFSDKCYHIGSSKLMDFCLTVGSEVETLFRLIIESYLFGLLKDPNYSNINQNINLYRTTINPIFKLHEYPLTINIINKTIKPFDDFNKNKTPEWFKTYSKMKHNKVDLINEWNIKHSIYALGGLKILLHHHPRRYYGEGILLEENNVIFDKLSFPNIGWYMDVWWNNPKNRPKRDHI